PGRRSRAPPAPSLLVVALALEGLLALVPAAGEPPLDALDEGVDHVRLELVTELPARLDRRLQLVPLDDLLAHGSIVPQRFGLGIYHRVVATNGKLTAKEFKTDQEVRWCPGCGDYAILAALQSFMPELDVPKEKIVFVSGIGCAARFPYYMETYGMHSIHGRAPAIATGLSTSRPDVMVWVVTGDGDALSLVIGAEATFVARSIDTDRAHLTAVLRAAAEHRGSSFVEIFQNCNIYNDGAFDFVRDDKTNRIYLEHGKPIRFGEDGAKGV